MCFALYAGTNRPLPRKKWEEAAAALFVKSLGENEAVVAKHFSRPEVQMIGSTSGCGCGFPHATLTGGAWLGFSPAEVGDSEEEESERFNREELVELLKRSGEQMVELYGIWLSGPEDFSASESFREDIPLERILEPTFRFKERGFYRVACDQVAE